MELSISNVINVSVAESQAGVGRYNTSNLALFSQEPFVSTELTDNGYKIYLEPTDVATDFGSASDTYKMALEVFSQQLNILTGGGYLVIIPFVTAVQHLALSGVPASGSFTLAFTQGTTAAINWNDSLSVIQGKIRVLVGLEDVVVTGSLASQALDLSFKGLYGPEALPTVGGAGLQTVTPTAITITRTTTTVGESMAAAITRTQGLVQYFGIVASVILSQVDMLAAGAVVQALNEILFVVQRDPASVEVGGSLDLLQSGDLTHARGLFYGSDNDSDALQMMAAYAGKGLSTNFTGSNTTQTMHLKDLAGIQPDPSMTQTLLDKCQAAGADVYVSIAGVPKVFCSGANDFFDNVYNLLAFVGDIKVAGFNYLAQTITKIPQTENGMTGLKNAYRNICQQYVNNQFVAPGSWTSPVTFGNQADLLANVLQLGYYIFSAPISQQNPADREARNAPLVQIAIKYAGAMHKSDVIIYVNK